MGGVRIFAARIRGNLIQPLFAEGQLILSTRRRNPSLVIAR